MKIWAFFALTWVSASLSTCKPRQSMGRLRSGPAPYQDTSYYDLGVRPDCSEKPFGYDDLLKIAKSPKIKNQQDLLNKIPPDAMQTFTLLHKSLSAQMAGISAEYPGVIRMRQDGKLVLRYTCNQKVDHIYNRVEVMRYDDELNKFRLTEINFQKSIKNRIKENPRNCYGCHNLDETTDDPRPNWEMYADWPGVFGSHDDFFPKGTAEDILHVTHFSGWKPESRQDEKKDFDTFLNRFVRSKETADPCYTSLPWLKPKENQMVPAAWQNYPYSMTNGHARDRVYALRPNLKMSEIFSHLLGKRNFRKIKEKEDYALVRRLLAVEAGRCLDKDLPGGVKMSSAELHTNLQRLLPSYQAPLEESARPVNLRGYEFFHHDPRHPSSLAQGLYGTAVAFGFLPGEWSLSFGDPEAPQYETGAGPGKNRDFPADLPLTAYTQHEILDEVARDPQMHLATAGGAPLYTFYERSTGESDDFGPHFACIDNIAGATVFKSEEAGQQACAVLVKEALDYQKTAESLLSQSRGGTTRGVGNPPIYPRPYRKAQGNLEDYLKKLPKDN